MAFEFGPFRLDEAGRALRLANRDVALQPLVFDLLAYLVRHRERVVPKDELLDALWPGVNVTENSLQRVVSILRSVLRDGGMDRVLKNYPGHGYRFILHAVSETNAPADDSADRAASGPQPHAQAVAEQRWSDAAALYEALDKGRALDAPELEQWGYALQCLGRPIAAVPILTRAIAAYSQANQAGSSARLAVSLSTIHMERNEMALAKGWAATAEDLLSGTPHAPEAGYVLWMQAKITAAEGELVRAHELADAAYKLGQQQQDAAIEALGLVYRGFYRASLGDPSAGIADQDRAAALALSQNVGPVTGSVLYCNILWMCRAFGDWARASQWTLGYRKFCADGRMEFSGSCQLHYAEVLGIQGSLKSALSHIEDALTRLADDAPWAVGDAYRVLGDLHAAIGHDGLAIDAFEKSYSLGWCPEPGYAMLLLERGEVDAARASLERSLMALGWWNMQRRGILLAHLALVEAHGARAEAAQTLIEDLAGQSVPSIRALTSEASALLAEQRGDSREAIRYLHLARQLWTTLDSRFHATRLRLKIGVGQLALGDRHGAAIELRAALDAALKLESEKLNQQCRELQLRLG